MCPISRNIQDQVGWGTGQPDLVSGNPACSRELKLDGFQGPFQPKIFCDYTLWNCIGWLFSFLYWFFAFSWHFSSKWSRINQLSMLHVEENSVFSAFKCKPQVCAFYLKSPANPWLAGKTQAFFRWHLPLGDLKGVLLMQKSVEIWPLCSPWKIHWVSKTPFCRKLIAIHALGRQGWELRKLGCFPLVLKVLKNFFVENN